MQSTINYKESSIQMSCNNFSTSIPVRFPEYPQNSVCSQDFYYSPFPYNHQYLSFPNHYHIPHQYLNPQISFWSQNCYNLKGTSPNQDFLEFPQQKVQKIQKKIIKAEPQEQVQVNSTSNSVKLPKRKYKMQKKTRKNNLTYYWSADQNKRYAQFLSVNAHLFSLSLSQKKNLRVNVLMSKKVKTRTPQQCHSHHQKMMKKYVSMENIIQKMKQNYVQGQQRQEIKQQANNQSNVWDQLDKDHINQDSQI